MTAIILIGLGLAAFWMLGGVALRWSGMIAVWLGSMVAVGVDAVPGLVLLATGTVGWLAGQLHHRLRHGDYTSRLVAVLLDRTGHRGDAAGASQS
jgi:chromate transport protein ChrA